MIIVLNGPLGIGKSTLAEALAEAIDHCVMLDGAQYGMPGRGMLASLNTPRVLPVPITVM